MRYSDLVNHFVYPVVYRDTSVNQFVLNTGKTLRVHKDRDLPMVQSFDDVEWVSFRGAFKLKDGTIYVFKDGEFVPFKFNENCSLYYPASEERALPVVLKSLRPEIEPADYLKEAFSIFFKVNMNKMDKATKDILASIAKKVTDKNAARWMKRYANFFHYMIACSNNDLSKEVIDPSEFLE